MAGEVPVRRRVLAVQADLGEGRSPRFLYGSGLLLGGRRMLTAAHVVAGAVEVTVRDPERARCTATVAGAKIGDPDLLDLAILEVPEAEEIAGVAVARVNREVATGAEEVEKCWALGYPAFSEVDRDGTGRSLRVIEEVNGVVPPLSLLEDGMLSFRVSSTPRALPPADTTLERSEWSGMSGAAVFAGDLLIGVVAEHAPRRGVSDITVTPLDRLLDERRAPADAGRWWELLGVTDPHALPLLPLTPARAEPEYRATMRVMRNRARPYLVDRRHELDQIAGFATGGDDVFGGDAVGDGYLWLVGGPWTGKTALLAEAVHTMPAHVDVVAFFLVARESRASQEHFLAAVVPQLAYLVDTDVPAAFSVDTFRALWDRVVDRADDRHLLLVVDALDEDLRSTGASVAALLPERLAPRSRVLVTSRPYPGMPERVELPPDVALHHPLRAAAAKRVVLSDSARAQELRELADQEIEALLSPLETSPDADLAFDVLGLLAAAGGALAVQDLAALTGARARVVRRFVTTDAAHSLQAVGSEDRRRYQYAHQTLVDRCRQHPDVGDGHYWDMLTAWADGWSARRWPSADDSDDGTPRYLLDTYPAVLAGATPTLYHGGADRPPGVDDPSGDHAHAAAKRAASGRSPEPASLVTLVTDVAWIDAAVSAVGVDAVLSALRTADLLAPAQPALAAMLRLVQLQAHHLRPPYPADRPGYPASQLAWEALRIGSADVAGAARERVLSCPGVQLIPEWSTERTGNSLIRVLGRHDGGVQAMAATPDGRVVTGGDDRTVRLWNPDVADDPGRELGRHHGGVWAMAVTPDGRVVTGGDDRAVRLWNPGAPDEPGRELGCREGWVWAMAATPDGRVASGGSDGEIMLWDPDAPDDPGRELGRHPGGVWAMAATPDGRVVSGGGDGVVRMWDPHAADDRVRELGQHQGRVWAMAVTSAGRVVSGGDDGSVWLWDPDVAGDPGLELGRHDGEVRAMATTPDGRVVSGGDDGSVRLWRPDAADDRGRELGRHHGRVWAMAVTSDGRVVSGGDDGSVRLWNPDAADDPGPLGRHGWIWAVATNPEGRVISGDDDGGVLVWNPADPDDQGRELGRHEGGVWAMAAAPDGRVVSGGDGGTVRMWDSAAPDDPGRELGRHPGTVWAMAVTPDGRVVSGGDGGAVLLWNPGTSDDVGRELGRHDGRVWAMATTPDGQLVSGGSDGVVLLWDPDAPDQPRRELGRHPGEVRAMATTPDGRVVSGGSGGAVRLWNPRAPDDPGRELGRHEGGVWAVTATADGRVVSGGDDGAVRLWDPGVPDDPGRELGRHDGEVRAMSTAPDGRVIIATLGGLTVFRIGPA